MSDFELSDSLLAKAAGWEVMKHARALLADGRVLSSAWKPPLLQGVIRSDESSMRTGLIIRNAIDIENLCPCRQSREAGVICAHAVAVALHALKPAADAAPSSRAESVSPGPRVVTRDPALLRRAPEGEGLLVHVLLPPNLPEGFARGRVMLVFEGETSRGRAPLNSYVKGGAFRICDEDERLLDAVERLAGGDTPGMIQLVGDDFLGILPLLAGHPRISIGRKTAVQVRSTPWAPPMSATLAPDGTIELCVQAGNSLPPILAGRSAVWVWRNNELLPLAGGAWMQEAVIKPRRVLRHEVPVFLSRDWPRLLEALPPVAEPGSKSAAFDCNFRLEDFELNPEPPRFVLNLAGGLAQLSATLQCRYGSRVMTLGVTSSDEAVWLPDPTNPRRYSTRDRAAEQGAVQRLRRNGFGGPDSQGRWQLAGQDRVMAFFAREHPRLEREWEVTLEERLDRSARNTFERVTPQLRVTSSGEQWFDLEVRYTGTGGEQFSAADIQRLVLGSGSARLKNGKIALIDGGAVEELQEVLLDCAPQQQVSTEGTRYRMGPEQAGFLEASLGAQGLTLAAPPAWRAKAARQTGEATLTCPPLGTLEDVLRPYQKHGVAWLRFLRESGFCGVLADEMGLGKTLQVLAHLAVLRRESVATNRKPQLVVCPTTLVFNWVAEATRFVPDLNVLVLGGAGRESRFDGIATADLVVTSYALLRRDIGKYGNVEFDTVILDEAQHIKNRQTQNARAVKAIRSEHRLVVTGTPLENSVLDLWSLYDFLMPGYLGTADDFRDRYEIPITREKDTATLQRLVRRVRPFLLRRRKSEVAPELPPRLRQVAWCELTSEQSVVYQQVLAATRKEVTDSVGEQGFARSRMVILTALLRLRQICCDLRLLDTKTPAADSPLSPGGKVQLFAELLDEVLDGGHRVLVFSQFTTMLGLLRDQLKADGVPFCYLDGSTRDRATVVQQFQREAGIPVFLISLKAGGTGLNLTGADTVIHFDPWWNPAVEDQATDRAHRIGQTRVVTSYKLITRGTVEEKILNLQNRKRDLLEATLTGEEEFAGKLNWEEIQELLS